MSGNDLEYLERLGNALDYGSDCYECGGYTTDFAYDLWELLTGSKYLGLYKYPQPYREPTMLDRTMQEVYGPQVIAQLRNSIL